MAIAITGCCCHGSLAVVRCSQQQAHTQLNRKPLRVAASASTVPGTFLKAGEHSSRLSKELSNRQSKRCWQIARTHERSSFITHCSAAHDGSDQASTSASAADQHTRQRVKVIFVWLLVLWFLCTYIGPTTIDFFGLDPQHLTTTAQALVHLGVDVGQLVVTIAILWKKLKKYRPRRLGWFETRLWPIQQWLVPVAIASIAFPVFDIIAKQAQLWFPDEDSWIVNIEHSIRGGDLVSTSLYLALVTFCGPVWEEAMFRGFLLPSFAKYMPLQIAIVLSAMVFAMAHCSYQRFPPLLALGIALGLVYTRTRNLMSPIALHSFWNIYIFWNLSKSGSSPFV